MKKEVKLSMNWTSHRKVEPIFLQAVGYMAYYWSSIEFILLIGPIMMNVFTKISMHNTKLYYDAVSQNDYKQWIKMFNDYVSDYLKT